MGAVINDTDRDRVIHPAEGRGEAERPGAERKLANVKTGLKLVELFA